MRAYYLTSERWALEAITSRRLKLSLFNEMNDPFELLGMELKTRDHQADFYQLKEEMNKTIGVLCFSRTWSNPVLWSHYGDKHRGVCLGFDILDDWAFEVSYQGIRLQEEIEVKLSGHDDDTIGHKLLTTKYEHWHYENEVRMILKLEDVVHENGFYFLSFCNALRLKEVIVGPRCTLALTNLRKNVSGYDKNVHLAKSRLSFRSYKVVKNRAVKSVD